MNCEDRFGVVLRIHAAMAVLPLLSARNVRSGIRVTKPCLSDRIHLRIRPCVDGEFVLTVTYVPSLAATELHP